jgi:hypothetical protein
MSSSASQCSRLLVRKLLIACALIGLGMNSLAIAQTQQLQSNQFRHPLVGSWLVTYDVPAFVVPIPILLSFTADGIIIETDSSVPTPFGPPIGTLVLSNGHGSWRQTGKNKFSYTYRKLLYDANGSSFGLVRTNGAVTTSYGGTPLQVDLDIRFTDNVGNVVLHATGTATGNRIEVED